MATFSQRFERGWAAKRNRAGLNVLKAGATRETPDSKRSAGQELSHLLDRNDTCKLSGVPKFFLI